MNISSTVLGRTRLPHNALAILALGATLVGVGQPTLAQIRIDSSFGPARSLSGPDYVLDALAGKANGNTLFFSFDRFSLQSRDTVTFRGPTTTTNIVSRVTGVQPSIIDGAIDTRSNMPGASFYLINPNGIALGPNARIDVGGSLQMSTANHLAFSDGSRFEAVVGTKLPLRSAEPAAFGFLGVASRSIVALGGQVTVGAGKTLSFVGGKPAISSGSFSAPNGSVRFVAARNGVIPVDGDIPTKTLDSAPLAAISTEVGNLRTDDGAVIVRAGRLLLDGATILNARTAASGARILAVDVAVSDIVRLSHGASIEVTATGSATARGGDIAIQADRVELMAGSGLLVRAGISARGGDIALSANSLTADQARIATHATENGSAGSIYINSRDGLLTSTELSSINSGSGAGGNIVFQQKNSLRLINSAVLSALDDGSKGGDVVVTAGHIEISGGSIRSRNSTDSGIGGSVLISAADVAISDKAALSAAGTDKGTVGNIDVHADRNIAFISGSTVDNTSSEGASGRIHIDGRSVQFSGASRIQAGTLASNAGGSVAIDGDDISFSERAGILSAALSQPVGDINVQARLLSLNDAYISSSTRSRGRAGDINLQIQQLVLENGGQIASSSVQRATGAAGNINIREATLVTISGSSPSGHSSVPSPYSLDSANSGLFTTTANSGAGGNIKVVAANLDMRENALISATSRNAGLAGNINITFDDTLSMERSVIASSSRRADGGDIQIRSRGSVLRMSESEITTSVGDGHGAGGNIILGSPSHALGSVVMRDSAVRANALGGPGGNVDVFAEVLLRSNSTITASSASNVQGTVDIQARVTDVSNALAELPNNLLQGQNLLRTSCAVRRSEGKTSSLLIVGREGVPPEPVGILSSIDANSFGPTNAENTAGDELWATATCAP